MRFLLMISAALLSGCTPAPPSDVEVVAYFRQHENQLTRLVELGEKHAALKRAEPSLSNFAEYYSEPSRDDLKAQEEAYRILKDMKADFVAWWRTPEGRVFEVTVPLYRYGLSLGGYSKGLEYIPDHARSLPRPDASRKYRQIEGTAWFIEESDMR